jgi:hypothetical protein
MLNYGSLARSGLKTITNPDSRVVKKIYRYVSRTRSCPNLGLKCREPVPAHVPAIQVAIISSCVRRGTGILVSRGASWASIRTYR